MSPAPGVHVCDRVLRCAQEQAARLLRLALHRRAVVAAIVATWPRDPGKRTNAEWQALRAVLPDGVGTAEIRNRTRQIRAYRDAHDGVLPPYSPWDSTQTARHGHARPICQKYSGKHRESQTLMLFSHGVESVGHAPIEGWQEVLARARKIGSFTGVDTRAYPRDFASLARTRRDLSRIRTTYPMPLPLGWPPVEEFLAGRDELEWNRE
ncbi:hypothetical protein ACTWPT_59600 [Nonomuraea sp. 3N208]|uniref:hypothetical protein n=1 Tax=Nonomuraea sp. 3N208 TaxID=3457421 RepID=UPI003FD1232E